MNECLMTPQHENNIYNKKNKKKHYLNKIKNTKTHPIELWKQLTFSHYQ